MPHLVSPTPLSLPLAELLSSFTYALDMTDGQPEGHSIRCCWIGTHIGQKMGLEGQELWELYYTLLLKDLGCSSNAARISQLYKTDDHSFKHDFKFLDSNVGEALKFLNTHAATNLDLGQRLKTMAHVMKNKTSLSKELITTRCTRGADIARQMHFSDAVAAGIHSLDEHWDGGGLPEGLKGNEIPIYSQIALLAQVIDVFFVSKGKSAALEEISNRSNRWFNSKLVSAFKSVAQNESFWTSLQSYDLPQRIFELEPAQQKVMVDDQWMDDIALAFGQVVDAKSPFTASHSERVGDISHALGKRMGISKQRLPWLRRAALLHDVGKLGVSNTILDKPGPLAEDEWASMRDHAYKSEQILSRITVFGDLARAASSHHERLDGTGYPRGLKGDEISLETRIITIADFYDALTADRPYRAAMPVDQALSIMYDELHTTIDPDCYTALTNILPELPAFAGSQDFSCLICA